MLVMRDIWWDGGYLCKGIEQRTSWVGQLKAFPECGHWNSSLKFEPQRNQNGQNKIDNKTWLLAALLGQPNCLRPGFATHLHLTDLINDHQINANFEKFLSGNQEGAVTKIAKFTKDRVSWFLRLHQTVMIISP